MSEAIACSITGVCLPVNIASVEAAFILLGVSIMLAAITLLSRK